MAGVLRGRGRPVAGALIPKPACASSGVAQSHATGANLHARNIAFTAVKYRDNALGGTLSPRIGLPPPNPPRTGDRRLLAPIIAMLCVVLIGAAARAQDAAPPSAAPPPPVSESRFTFSGLVFGDYYYFSRDHDAAWQGQDGVWFRRLYATFDYTFTPKVTTRIRLEMNSDGQLQGGLLTPYVKDAWLRWTFLGRQQLTLGMHPSVGIEHVESVWGLRHIEKTPLDLYKWDSSRETGVSLAGPLTSSGVLKYQVQLGNDAGSGSETDRFKDVRAALWFEPAPGLVLEGMYGYFSHADHGDFQLAQAVAAYRRPGVRAGFQYARQIRQAPSGAPGPDLRLDLLSAFAVADVRPRKWSVFARVDRHADPCPNCAAIDYLPISTEAPFTMLVAGAEYFLLPSVRFSPNVEWVTYSAPKTGAEAPGDDVVWRVTFFWSW